MITPESYIPFYNEDDYRDRCVGWGLITEKAKLLKKEFLYKGAAGEQNAVLAGYLNSVFVVIRLSSGEYHSIHPAFLKEMQASKFIYPTYSPTAVDENESISEDGGDAAELTIPMEIQPNAAEVKQIPDKPIEKSAKKPAAKTVALPEGKVQLFATVDRFDTRYDPFTESEQEVILFSNLSWKEEETLKLDAWSSYGVTLKKAELALGDRIVMEGKLANKKLDKDIRIKVNNAAKIEKMV